MDCCLQLVSERVFTSVSNKLSDKHLRSVGKHISAFEEGLPDDVIAVQDHDQAASHVETEDVPVATTPRPKLCTRVLADQWEVAQ